MKPSWNHFETTLETTRNLSTNWWNHLSTEKIILSGTNNLYRFHRFQGKCGKTRVVSRVVSYWFQEASELSQAWGWDVIGHGGADGKKGLPQSSGSHFVWQMGRELHPNRANVSVCAPLRVLMRLSCARVIEPRPHHVELSACIPLKICYLT